MSNVVQDMIENHQSHYATDENGVCTVRLRPKEIANVLKDKLSEDDINQGMNIVNQMLNIERLKNRLHHECYGVQCANADKCMFRSIPTGNINADVMLVNKMPSRYETYNMSTHCDETGVFLSLILNKMNIPLSSVYCTDFIKCSTDSLDESSYNNCIKEYFEKELSYIKPKLIICNGLPLLNTMARTGMFIGLPGNLTYGNIYNAQDSSGNSYRIVAIYELTRVLQKTGEQYEKCKTELWGQLLNAFKSIYQEG